MTTEPDRLGALLRVLRRPKPPVGTTPADVVLRDNKWRLLRYRSSTGAPAKYATPVLLVPSLINRHYVLDLLPGKSFAEFMVEQGHDVLYWENVEGGHGGAANNEQSAKMWALSWTFLWQELTRPPEG